MAVEYRTDDMFKSGAEALVNATNTIGVMGGGIALTFQNKFPAMFKDYYKACKRGEHKIGTMHVYEYPGKSPRFIINFPTKVTPGENSRYEYVSRGLPALIQTIKAFGIKSVAIPALGCGLGGLEWEKVKPMIETACSELPEVTFYVYPPQDSWNGKGKGKGKGKGTGKSQQDALSDWFDTDGEDEDEAEVEVSKLEEYKSYWKHTTTGKFYGVHYSETEEALNIIGLTGCREDTHESLDRLVFNRSRNVLQWFVERYDDFMEVSRIPV